MSFTTKILPLYIQTVHIDLNPFATAKTVFLSKISNPNNIMASTSKISVTAKTTSYKLSLWTAIS